MTSVQRRLSAAVREARLAALDREARLISAYRGAVKRAAKDMRAKFLELYHLEAAADWNPPTVEQVTSVLVNNDRIRTAQHAMMAAVTGAYSGLAEVSFTTTHPVSQAILDKMGARVEGALTTAARERVSGVIASAWAEGLSVDDTAAAIRSSVAGASDSIATMLARTDLIGMSNGMGQEAVKQVNDASQAAGEGQAITTKTWLATPDDRTRDTHQEADGQTVPMDEPYEVGDALLMYPGDPDGPDEEVINCRCTEIYGEEPAAGDAPEGDAETASADPFRDALTRSLQERLHLPGEPAASTSYKLAGLSIDIANAYQGATAVLGLPTGVPFRERPTGGAVGTTTAPKGRASDLRLRGFGRSNGEFAELQGAHWISDLAFDGRGTGDGRFIVPGALTWRDLPLTLLAMTETPDFGGHAGAEVSGRIDSIEARDIDMSGAALPEGEHAYFGTGQFDTGAFAQDVERMVGNETLRGVSVDMAVLEWAFRDPETGDILDPDEMTEDEWDKAFFGELDFAIIQGEIMAATICATPAFADARIAIVASADKRRVPHPKIWHAGSDYADRHEIGEGQLMTTLFMPFTIAPGELAASANGKRPGIAPVAPPTAWFFRPEAEGPTPLTITDDGEVYGHIALWDTCHTGYINQEWSQCVRAPRSKTNYARFHVAEMRTAEAELIPIGHLTIDTDHAPMGATPGQVRAHYDNTGTVAAYVRALDGMHGIWISGATRSNMSDEQLRDLRASPPSGDWRTIDHNLELHACLGVVVAGFPVERAQMAMAASANGDMEVVALILTASMKPEEQEQAGPTTILSAEVLAASIAGPEALHALIEGNLAYDDEGNPGIVRDSVLTDR